MVSKMLQQLSAFTEQLEANEREIVELMPQNADLLAEDGIDVDLTIAVPLIANHDELPNVTLNATDTSITDDGKISVELSIHVPKQSGVDEGHDTDEVEERDAKPDPKTNGATDGGTAIDASESSPKESETGSSNLAESSAVSTEELRDSEERTEHPTETEGENDNPPYKDPERLAEVYESCNTFAEMTDALGVDVTPQTVRNHMIDHGIHDPNTNTSSTSESEEDNRFLGEGEIEDLDVSDATETIVESVELPDDLTFSEVTEAVQAAKTLYEVQRELGLERKQTRCMLAELNLLELVHGRVSTRATRSKSKEEIEQRIQNAVTGTETAT